MWLNCCWSLHTNHNPPSQACCPSLLSINVFKSQFADTDFQESSLFSSDQLVKKEGRNIHLFLSKACTPINWESCVHSWIIGNISRCLPLYSLHVFNFCIRTCFSNWFSQQLTTRLKPVSCNCQYKMLWLFVEKHCFQLNCNNNNPYSCSVLWFGNKIGLCASTCDSRKKHRC